MFEEENRWWDPIAGGTNFRVQHHIIFRKNISVISDDSKLNS